MFGIDLCNVKMKLEYNLKFSLRHPYYIQLQQRLPNKIKKKSQKEERVVFSSQTRTAKSEKVLKNYRFKHELKLLFFSTLNRGG